MESRVAENLMRRFNVGDALRRTALRRPNSPALLFEGRTVSYRELDELANRAADLLLALGLERGDRVAVLGLNTPEFAATWLGSSRIGAVLLPINAMLRGAEIDYVLSKATPQVLVVDGVLLGNLTLDSPAVRAVPNRFVLQGPPPDGWRACEAALADAGSGFPERFVANEDPSTLIFTSDTESFPKGVVNTHLNWFAALLSAATDLGITRQNRLLMALPLFHVAGMYVLLATLNVGAAGVMVRRFDPMKVLEAIDRQEVDYLVLPSTAYVGLLRVPGIERRNFAGLKRAVVFQYLPTQAFERWLQLAPQAEWMSYWGQSELTPLGSVTPPEDLRRKLSAPDPIGLPHLPLEVRVADESGSELPPGRVGELLARGPAVMQGYYEDPERTAQTFRGGWHHTGDLGYRDEEGYLYFVDRIKDVIKSGGENVSSQEVEEAIAEHPAVAEVVVIGTPDPYWIEVVTAVVVTREPATAEEIITHCRSRLSSFKVPKRVQFVDSLPRNPAGKILKRELRRQFAGEAGA